MLIKTSRAFTVEETTRPGELLAHGSGPNLRRQRSAQRPLELRTFDRTQPRADSFDHLQQVRPGGGVPVIQRLPAFDDDRAVNAPDADDPVEPSEHLGNTVETCLIDPRVHAAPLAVRPALPVEESGCPGEVVILQPRDLDRTRRACLSSKRAKTSSKCAKAVAQMCARPGIAARQRADVDRLGWLE